MIPASGYSLRQRDGLRGDLRRVHGAAIEGRERGRARGDEGRGACEVGAPLGEVPGVIARSPASPGKVA